MNADRLFLLALPGLVLLMVIMLVWARLVARQWSLVTPADGRATVNWLCAGAVGLSVALGLQSLMDNSLFVRFSLLTAVIHVISVMCFNRAVAVLFRFRAPLWLELTVAGLGMAFVWWYALVRPDVISRIVVLGAVLTGLHLCVLPQILLRMRRVGAYERLMGVIFTMIVVLGTIRVGWLLWNRNALEQVTFTASPHWQLVLVLTVCFILVLLSLALMRMVIGIYETLQMQRDTDALSGLLNRRGFLAGGEARLRAGRGERWFLILGDLDHFKKINDNYGHAAGDAVIRDLGQILAATVPQGSLSGRLGGEEFAVLLQAEDLADASRFAGQLRERLALRHWPHGGRVTMSFGVEPVGGVVDFAAALLRADRRLYEAKFGGRNRVSTGGPPGPGSG